MSPLTIAPVEKLPFRAAISVFFTTFGAIWLMIEPMEPLGILPSLSRWAGLLSYLGMLGFAIVVTLLSAKIYRIIRRSKLTFVTFTVVSATEGSEYMVRAPINMQVWDFTSQFVQHLLDGPAKDRVQYLNQHYNPVLQIERGANFFDLDAGHTLAQAGIIDGIRCQIRGKPKEHQILFSKSPA